MKWIAHYLIYVEERQDTCPPGSFVYVPPNVPHTFKVVSQEPGKKLNIFSPAAMVGFFEGLAEAEANGTATPELLNDISERNGMGWASSAQCRRLISEPYMGHPPLRTRRSAIQTSNASPAPAPGADRDDPLVAG